MTSFLPLFQALGLTLLHMSWEGALIAGAYAAGLWLIPAARPNARYVLGLSSLLAILVAALATFTYELTRQPAGFALDVVAAAPALAQSSALGLSRWLPVLDAVWLAGVLLLSLRMAGGLWQIGRLSVEAQAVPLTIRRRFEAALDRAGLSRRVEVRLNTRIDSPFVVGLMRAVVYLPLSAVTALGPEQLDAVFAHELEHVRRGDYGWNLVQSLVETLFFYHPPCGGSAAACANSANCVAMTRRSMSAAIR